MFDLDGLEIANFRSFKGWHRIVLPRAPGLYHLTGQNLENPRLGPNGIGKSTLLEAIHWALYGKTSRGLKAGDIVTWGEKGCEVTVTLTIGSEKLTVKRTQNPNSLAAGNDTLHPCDQEALQQKLRLTQEAFTCAVMVPQFGDAFFDLPPSGKLALFSQIMELDYWLEKSGQADGLAKKLKAECDRLSHEISNLEGRQSSLQDDIDSLRVKSMAFAKEKEQKLDELDAKILAAEETFTAAVTAHSKATASLAACPGITSEKFNEARLAKEKATADLAVTKSHYATLKVELANCLKLRGKCPTCGQKISSENSEDHIHSLDVQLSDLTVQRDARQKAEAAAAKKLSDVAAENMALGEKRDALTEALHKAKTKVEIGKAKCLELRKALSDESNRANPFIALLTKQQNLLKEVEEKLAGAVSALDRAKGDYEATNFWVAGFKRLRLYVIEEALQSLELEVSNTLASLGLSDWQVSFDVERETKAGGVTRGFVVLISSPGHREPVRWEAWSGGETQRLRLAGDMGLANLIMTRAGLVGKIEWWDEPSRHLSQEGMLDLAETLQARALQQGKRIYLVDHNVIDFGGFAGVLNITKDANGSICNWS